LAIYSFAADVQQSAYPVSPKNPQEIFCGIHRCHHRCPLTFLQWPVMFFNELK
jgi:hypothetical protein